MSHGREPGGLDLMVFTPVIRVILISQFILATWFIPRFAVASVLP